MKKITQQPSEVVYIDDSGKNIEAAQKLGIKSHQFSDKAKLEIFLKNNVSNDDKLKN